MYHLVICEHVQFKTCPIYSLAVQAEVLMVEKKCETITRNYEQPKS